MSAPTMHEMEWLKEVLAPFVEWTAFIVIIMTCILSWFDKENR